MMSSLNLAVSTATLRSLDSLSAPASGHGSKLTASVDGDWCGTKVPHPPIPHALEVALRNSRFEQVMLNPQPLPPGPDGALQQRVGRATLDNDWCGTVPKHFPPPPPPIADLLSRGLK